MNLNMYTYIYLCIYMCVCECVYIYVHIYVYPSDTHMQTGTGKFDTGFICSHIFDIKKHWNVCAHTHAHERTDGQGRRNGRGHKDEGKRVDGHDCWFLHVPWLAHHTYVQRRCHMGRLGFGLAHQRCVCACRAPASYFHAFAGVCDAFVVGHFSFFAAWR